MRSSGHSDVSGIMAFRLSMVMMLGMPISLWIFGVAPFRK